MNCEPFGFMPDVQFLLGEGKPFFNIQIGGGFDIAAVEAEIERLWIHFGNPYYELW
jgi:hypothetical protein